MNFAQKKIVIFDLDGTLAPSKSRMLPDMTETLGKLMQVKQVAVISGGMWEQFEKQFLSALTDSSDIFHQLFLMPTSGTRLYVWRDGWQEVYAELLSDAERAKIRDAFAQALRDTHYVEPAEIFGDVIEDRGSQVTFSALGQKAPGALKEAWDPDGAKRAVIAQALEKYIPEFNIGQGGTTSIDITKKGVDKAFGVRKLAEHLGLSLDEILFIGDKIIPGGNDYPVRQMGVDSIQVTGPDMTRSVLEEFLNDSR